MATSKTLDTLQDRFKYWRNHVARISLREVQEAVNKHLEKGVSLPTVNNYEVAKRASPRTSFILALKRAFPDLNLEWLLLGDGEPRLSQKAAGHFVAHHVPVDSSVERPLDLMSYANHFPSLTGAARWVAVSFLNEVKLSDQKYWSNDSQEWKALLRQIVKMLEGPLKTPGPFVERKTLSNSEIMTFALTMTAALRPLIPSLRPDRLTPERDAVSKGDRARTQQKRKSKRRAKTTRKKS